MKLLLVRALLPLVAGGALLAGCTSTQQGTASPAQSSTAGGGETSAPESSSAAGGGTQSITDPCTLLEKGDLATYGDFNEPENKTLGTARVCKYQKKIASASDKSMVVGVNVRDDARADQLNDQGAGVSDKDVNGRKAKEAPETQGVGCTLALPVGDSRVDVLVTAVGSTDEACQIAETVAKTAVEPRLPKG
ncbi:DUF3558 family protein [Amycolatopsis australiensis]|uniref:DUF3558 domain-containing protein n=1 Tax=Amycolatopsis australiensis TaxID=546364 RepID=A0A1K1PT22_9PSEU|nr:DUF3558 family protein [Amycolatopsis australiensis]SFW50824.1 Protein of unknown function [Amycolatopsis australiensis]